MAPRPNRPIWTWRQNWRRPHRMKSVVRPELPTASAGPSQAPAAAVDNSAPRSTHPEPTYKSGKAVQTTGTTSISKPLPWTRSMSESTSLGRCELNNESAIGTLVAVRQLKHALLRIRSQLSKTSISSSMINIVPSTGPSFIFTNQPYLTRV
jgi:hypothetical protein